MAESFNVQGCASRALRHGHNRFFCSTLGPLLFFDCNEVLRRTNCSCDGHGIGSIRHMLLQPLSGTAGKFKVPASAQVQPSLLASNT